MDGRAIGAAAVGDVGLRAAPSEAVGPRAAGTRVAERTAPDEEARTGKVVEAERVARAERR